MGRNRVQLGDTLLETCVAGVLGELSITGGYCRL
jgi:hypothetical protein